MAEAFRSAVITVSSSAANGAAEDISGPLLAGLLEGLGATTPTVEIVPDDFEAIAEALSACVKQGIELVLTTGGTGMSVDDVTPEATASVIERDAPGFAEAIRAEAARQLATGILTRGRSGIAGSTLIINLPGSPRAVEESLAVIGPALAHAAGQLGKRGSRASH
jgi:molybdenum cofactor synthesis domain-containing protein